MGSSKGVGILPPLFSWVEYPSNTPYVPKQRHYATLLTDLVRFPR